MILVSTVVLQCWLITLASRARHRARTLASGERRGVGDGGQTTAEYALVLIGAAALAVLLIAWATRTDRVGKLFDFVMDQITGRVR